MINLYDIAYGLGVGISAPVWAMKPSARQKVVSAFSQRMGNVPPRLSQGQAVMIHAVSLGEMNATRGLVTRLRELRPDLDLIISATTETGFARAQELYGKPGADTAKMTIIWYPLDFTAPVCRVLDHLRPSAVVLMELEVWPNFLRQCAKRDIPVVLVNGRMTEPSFRRYRLIKPIVSGMFRQLAALCVQDQANADRFAALGATRDRMHITGTMKFDTATVADRVPGDEELGKAVGFNAPNEPIWVCGSTGPGEEQIVLEQYRQLLGRFSGLRLAIIPRHPQRFDDVAELIKKMGFTLVRRSAQGSALSTQHSAQPPVVLGDTMGELRKFYGLATVVFVGRTLVDLGARQHGSDMIEPAALGKPVIVGPFTGNFADAMGRFRAGDAMIEVHSGEELGAAVAKLLANAEEASRMGRAGREVVVNEKGATERHVRVILEQIGDESPASQPRPA
ncbi:MAG: 3-deoxy-D-manno-octulosonic acid transferase [Bacillota bacterium]